MRQNRECLFGDDDDDDETGEKETLERGRVLILLFFHQALMEVISN